MSRHPERVARYLQDIVDSIQSVHTYVTNKSREQFDSDPMLQDAVIRRLEIIGEAARRIEKDDKSFIGAHPELHLLKAYGLRNRLSHAYDMVNLDVVWSVARTNLAEMEKAILQYLARQSRPAAQ